MRWGDIKVITIKKLFLGENDFSYNSLEANSSGTEIEEYLNNMIWAANEGLQRIYQYGYPRYTYKNGIREKVKVEQITDDTPNDYEMKTYTEALVLLPSYIASQIYKDDDLNLATTYRNEFEVGLQELEKNIENEQIEVVYNLGDL